MKRVLITGKNSYIGTAIEQRLLGEPGMFDVRTVDVRGFDWLEMDFSGYDSVFHVAGIAHVPPSNVQDESYRRVNCDLAVDLALKAKREGVRQFIFMSSSIVYGDSRPFRVQTPIACDTALAPANVYGESKAEAESRLQVLWDNHFAVALLRCPMVYGPSCVRGNFPALVRLAQKAPFFPQIRNKRSMLYVGNLAELVSEIVKQGRGGIFLPQNKECVSTSEVVRIIAEQSGRRMRFTSLFNPLVEGLTAIHPLARKAFGNLFYEESASDFGFEYQKYSLVQSIEQIAEKDGWRQ